MIRRLRPILRGSTYGSAVFAYCCALAGLLVLPPALIPALVWSSAPEIAQIALVLLAWAVLLGLVGMVRGARRVMVVCARRALGVPLPDPPVARQDRYAAHPGPSGSDRWRSPAWLVLQVALGWLGLVVTGTLLAAGVALPANWLDGQARLSLAGRSLQLTGGWQSYVAALACLVAAVIACAVVGGIVRWMTPRLLGPSASERLALAAEREHALAERNRLAHELHDSIGHTLTATTIQAAVAGEVLSADPVAARAALRSIEESSRVALEDLDYVLGVLREDATGSAPSRTLADLPDLLGRLQGAGAVIHPQLSGDLTRVRAPLSRAAYRIVQEGLTNALRHGAGGPIELRVAAGPGLLELTVTNRVGARGTATFATSGHGLPGLAERVRLLNGEFAAGPDESLRWQLSVRLPA